MIMELALSFWSIVGVIVALQIVGFLWYGPIWGKLWSRETGISPDAVSKSQMKKKTLQHLILLIVKVVGFAALIPYISGSLFVVFGLIWVGTTLPGILMSVIWERLPYKVALIGLGMEIVNLAIIAGAYVWVG